MRKECKLLLDRSLDSIFLSVEHFNRPWDRGRVETVLILLDRGFELLLKSVIVHKGGKIREPRATQTIGFDACVRKCVSDTKLQCITEEEALTIQIVNSLRDAAQHYIVEVSEDQLYVYCQSALTLYDKILNKVFSKKLTDYFSDRVLPISSNPPKDFGKLMEVEFEDIKKLEKPGSRKRLRARTKLRSMAIVEASLGGNRLQPTEADMKKLEKHIRGGSKWSEVFPNIRRLSLSSSVDNINVSLHITKKEGEPVYLVPEGTPGATIVAIRKINELSFYSMGLVALSEKLNVGQMRCLALIYEYDMQNNPDYFKAIKMGSQTYKRYSPLALDFLLKKLPSIDVEKIWLKWKSTFSRRRNADGT